MSGTTLSQLAIETKDGDWGLEGPQPEYSEFAVIRGTDFEDVAVGEVQDVPTRFLADRTSARRTLEAGDIIIETAGGSPRRPTGRTLMVTQRTLELFDKPVTCSSFARFIRIDPNLADSEFIFWQLQHLYRTGVLETFQVQHTGVARFQYTTFANTFRFSLPPRAEQQAIAEVLGALDDKIAANTKLAATADELAGHIYDTTVREWNRKPISALLTPVLGGTPSRANDEFWAPATNLWISARDITGAPSRVVLDTAEKISPLATTNTKAKPLPVGSVILTARGTVGAVARLARPAAFNQSCYGFSPGAVPAEVLFFSILRAAEQAQKIAHGSVFDTITKSTFDHLEMAWDAIEASELSLQLAPLFRAIDTALEENHTLAAIRDALLPQLMSGRLRVRDAEKLAGEIGA